MSSAKWQPICLSLSVLNNFLSFYVAQNVYFVNKSGCFILSELLHLLPAINN